MQMNKKETHWNNLRTGKRWRMRDLMKSRIGNYSSTKLIPHIGNMIPKPISASYLFHFINRSFAQKCNAFMRK